MYIKFKALIIYFFTSVNVLSQEYYRKNYDVKKTIEKKLE